jgi:hypothetical protein
MLRATPEDRVWLGRKKSKKSKASDGGDRSYQRPKGTYRGELSAGRVATWARISLNVCLRYSKIVVRFWDFDCPTVNHGRGEGRPVVSQV